MADEDDRARERRAMVRDIEGELRLVQATCDGIPSLSPRLLAALEAVPRHRFVPESAAALAYENRPLPIGGGQTISQPFIVALMTALLEPAPDDRVLEVGTGSGYQAAILSRLVRAVFSVEVIESLARGAESALRACGCDNVEVRVGDGARGWPEHAPFDGIIVTAAAREVPPALIEQLAPGGRLVLPIGPVHGAQELIRLRKDAAGVVRRDSILPVAFVPLVPTTDTSPPEAGYGSDTTRGEST